LGIEIFRVTGSGIGYIMSYLMEKNEYFPGWKKVEKCITLKKHKRSIDFVYVYVCMVPMHPIERVHKCNNLQVIVVLVARSSLLLCSPSRYPFESIPSTVGGW